MYCAIQSYVKNCKGQVNMRHDHEYVKLPTKLVIPKPWEALFISLICPYTLNGQDGTVIDFMCLDMMTQQLVALIS